MSTGPLFSGFVSLGLKIKELFSFDCLLPTRFYLLTQHDIKEDLIFKKRVLDRMV